MDTYPTFRLTTRSAATYVLYASGIPQATAALVQVLANPDTDIRTSDAGWLVHRKDPAAIDAAVPVLLNGSPRISFAPSAAPGMCAPSNP